MNKSKLIPTYMGRITYILFAALIFVGTLNAEDVKPEQDTKRTGKIKDFWKRWNKKIQNQDDLKNFIFPKNIPGKKNRISLSLGTGWSNYQPGTVSEAGPAWTINSAIRASSDPLYQGVFNFSSPKSLEAFAGDWGIDYNYADRLNLSYRDYRKGRRYNSSRGTTVDFLQPATSNFNWSAFEGMRLIEYKEHRRTIKAEYIRPAFTRGLKIGLYFGREWYTEENSLSFGSLSQTSSNVSSNPGLLSWSEAGIVPTVYEMKSWVYGPVVRYQIFHWFGVKYTLTPVSRSGTMTMAGVQPITRQATDGTSFNEFLAPVATASVKDSGMNHNLEAVFRIFCRYFFHVGMIKEELTRNYNFYAGTTLQNSLGLFSMKTPTNLGIGEMSSSHKISNLEIYMRLSISLCF